MFFLHANATVNFLADMSRTYSDINLMLSWLNLVLELFREMVVVILAEETLLLTKVELENVREVKTQSSAHKQKRQSYFFRLLKGC